MFGRLDRVDGGFRLAVARFLRTQHEKLRRARRLAAEADVDGVNFAVAALRHGQRAHQRLAARLGGDVAERSTALGAGAQAQKCHVGVGEQALAVDLGNADRRIVEQPRELQFREMGAAVAGLSRPPQKHQRARRPGLSVGVEIGAVNDSHRHRAAILRLEIEIECFGALLPGCRSDPENELATVWRSDVLEPQAAVRGFLEFQAQPLGERCVDVGDAAAGLGRKKSGRCAIEIADDVLQPGKCRLLLPSIAADVGDPPQGIGLPEACRDGGHRDAPPRRLVPLRACRRRAGLQPEFLLRGRAPACRLGEPVDSVRYLGAPGIEVLHPDQPLHTGLGEERAVGRIGMNDPATAVRHHKGILDCVRQPVQERSLTRGRPHVHDAAEQGQNGEHPHGRQHAETQERPDGELPSQLPAEKKRYQDRHHRREPAEQRLAEPAPQYGVVRPVPLRDVPLFHSRKSRAWWAADCWNHLTGRKLHQIRCRNLRIIGSIGEFPTSKRSGERP